MAPLETAPGRICLDVKPPFKLAAAGAAAVLGLAAAGCDPVINLGGANFPGWLLCAILGLILAALLRQLFAVAGIEPYMGPAVVIYPCLAILVGCVIWMVFFNRV
jgi:YtcA family